MNSKIHIKNKNYSEKEKGSSVQRTVRSNACFTEQVEKGEFTTIGVHACGGGSVCVVAKASRKKEGMFSAGVCEGEVGTCVGGRWGRFWEQCV